MSIEGQVAGIVDASTLLINRGERHGVRPGMRFAVFAEVEEVRDPASGESLGRWELVKGTVAAVHVQPLLTICGPVPEEAPAGGESRTLSAEMAAASMPGRAYMTCATRWWSGAFNAGMKTACRSITRCSGCAPTWATPRSPTRIGTSPARRS